MHSNNKCYGDADTAGVEAGTVLGPRKVRVRVEIKTPKTAQSPPPPVQRRLHPRAPPQRLLLEYLTPTAVVPPPPQCIASASDSVGDESMVHLITINDESSNGFGLDISLKAGNSGAAVSGTLDNSPRGLQGKGE